MKILAVSDHVETLFYERLNRREFSGIDLILSCGDLPPEYLSFLLSAFSVPLYYIRGNHDIRYKVSPPAGCGDLNGRMVRFGGLNILGLEGSRWYNGGPVQYTESQMRRSIRRLRFKLWGRPKPDIIITHAPPRHIHDAEDPCHKGFKSFLPLIERYAPRYFLHGHIHAVFTNAEQRVTMFHNTRVINTFGHIVIETDDG